MTTRILTALALLSAALIAILLLTIPDVPETLGRFALIAGAFYGLASAGVILAHEKWGRA
jgi:hypothetical protein